MQFTTFPPLRDPLDLVAAGLHVVSNEILFQLSTIIGSISACSAGKIIANDVRQAIHHKGLIDTSALFTSLNLGSMVAAIALIASFGVSGVDE